MKQVLSISNIICHGGQHDVDLKFIAQLFN